MLNIKDSTKIMVLQETYTLSNNVLPRLAFGTWQLTEEEAQSAVKDALKAGYRMVDTAVQYENETGVGKAVRESGISREEVTVVTKIPHDVKTYDGAKAEIGFAETAGDGLHRPVADSLAKALARAVCRVRKDLLRGESGSVAGHGGSLSRR